MPCPGEREIVAEERRCVVGKMRLLGFLGCLEISRLTVTQRHCPLSEHHVEIMEMFFEDLHPSYILAHDCGR
jgi:hypothetical protein